MHIRDFFWAFVDVWVETNKGNDPATIDQCVDLWRAYNRKVIQAPDIFGNPPDIWANYQQEFYEKIPNTPDVVPQLGDVIIWSAKYGGYGHIAICTEIADENKFTSFDQNDPLKSPCHFQEHPYTHVLGWLRPKNQANIVDVNPNDQVSDLQDKVKSLNEQLATALLENNGLRTDLESQKRDNTDLTNQLLTARSERDQAVREKEEALTSVAQLEKELEEAQKGITSRDEEIKGLREALAASVNLRIDKFPSKELLEELIRRLIHGKGGAK